MAKTTAGWVGGDFVWARQFGSGRSNSGNDRKKFGNACMRRRLRFNPNSAHVRKNHPGDLVTIQSMKDKAKYEAKKRIA